MNELLEKWIKKAKTLAVEEMSPSLTNAFISLAMAESNPSNIKPEALEDEWVGVIGHRAEAIGLQMTVPTKLFLRILAGNPGRIIMYVAMLKAEQARTKHEIMDMTALAYLFPNGFITKNGLSELWEAQKVERNGNLVNLLDLLTEEDF